MRQLRALINCGLGIVLLTACASAQLTSPTNHIQPPPTQTTSASANLPPFNTVDFPQAQSISVVSDAEGVLYVALGQKQSVFIARSTDGGRTFSDPVRATEDHSVHVLPIERPAIAVSQRGQIGVAWLEIPPDYNGGQIWYATSDDGGQTFTPGQLVATESSGETTMVELALDGKGNPLLFWLNGSHLRSARSGDQGVTFSAAQSIGAGSCECCQPQALALNEQVYIAYRGLEPGGANGDIRDILLLRSEDGGATFEPVTRVSDTHWYLSACPIAGPSLVADEGNLYVAWMDGRSAPPGTFSRGDVWLAESHDGGQSFSPNVRINSDQDRHHTKPSIGIGPGGHLHVAWEAQAADSDVLYYTRSENGGQTFAPPQVIASNADGSRGRPRMAVLSVNSLGQVALAWLDQLGAHLSVWPEPN